MASKEKSSTQVSCQFLVVVDPRMLLVQADARAQHRFYLLLFLLAQAGYGLARVICVGRTLVEQEKIFGRGRSESECIKAGVDPSFACPGVKKVTWVLPAASNHVRGLAVDIDLSMYKLQDRHLISQIACTAGLRWGGDWKVKDDSHFEV